MSSNTFEDDEFAAVSETTQLTVRKSTKPPTPYNVVVPPGERISLLGQYAKNSKETDWQMLPNIGWALTRYEMTAVSTMYFLSAFSKKYFTKSKRVRLDDGGSISMDEVEGNYLMCEATGGYFTVKNKCNEPVYTPEDKPMCVSKQAFKQYFKQCSKTKRWYNTDYVYTVVIAVDVNGEPGASVNIGKAYLMKKTYNDDGDERRDSDYYQCAECGDWFSADLVPKRAEFHNKRYCLRCYKQKLRRNAIRPYSDKNFLPPLIEKKYNLLKGVKTEVNNPRWFGVECELGFNIAVEREEVAIELLDVIGRDFCLAKHDGSICATGNPKNGFELVTAPCDLDTHRKRWPKIEEYARFKDLRSWDTDTCGMHVHVSRAALSALQIGRILVFINHPDNKKFVQQVAGRGEIRWTRYYDKKLTDSINPQSAGRDADRRVAVNLTNEKTIEFRIFRGTINPRHIIRNVEFVDAVCDYCWPCSRSFKDLLDYKLFLKFVEERAKQWPLFAQWARAEKHIRQHNLKPGTKPPEVEEMKAKKPQYGEGCTD